MWSINKIKKPFLDLFFPKKCLGCGIPDTYLCRDCFNKIRLSENNTCFFCGKITWQGLICFDCRKTNYLDRIISAAEYKAPLIRELIKNFKYHYVQELADPLSQILIKAFESNAEIPTNPVIVIPVPLHKARKRSRGFNQAELLAKQFASYFQLPMETSILKRIGHTAPQARIKNVKKRENNIKNVFAINSQSIKGKIIILVDDVITTGATLIEAAKVLKFYGAKEVWAITVAKG